MLISVDLGFSNTKVVAGEKKIIFPSAVAPASNNLVNFGQKTGHVVSYQLPVGTENKSVFIGELAQKYGRAMQMGLSRDKFISESSIILALAGAYLAGAKGDIDLALGLPLAYYKQQRDQVKNRFKKIKGNIKVDEGGQHYISFENIHVLPQGVGVVFSLDQLPKEGIVGVLDIGYFTTDYLLIECHKLGIEPLPGYAGSLELGVSTAHKLFADRFNQVTGGTLSLTEVQNQWDKEIITYKGKPLDIRPLKEEAQRYVVTSIIEGLKSAWSEKYDFISNVIQAGGGSLAFSKQIEKSDLPGIIFAPEPTFANAIGFKNMVEKS